MWNGFYRLDHLNLKQLKAFYKDCIQLAFEVRIDKLIRMSRERCETLSIKEYLRDYIDLQTHNVAIDRFKYNEDSPVAKRTNYIEVGSRYSSKMKEPDYFIFIYINRVKFENLIEKYSLSQLTY